MAHHTLSPLMCCRTPAQLQALSTPFPNSSLMLSLSTQCWMASGIAMRATHINQPAFHLQLPGIQVFSDRWVWSREQPEATSIRHCRSSQGLWLQRSAHFLPPYLPRIQNKEGGNVLHDLCWFHPIACLIIVINTVHTELHSNFNFMLLWRILFKVMFKNNLCKLPKNRSSNVTFLDR